MNQNLAPRLVKDRKQEKPMTPMNESPAVAAPPPEQESLPDQEKSLTKAVRETAQKLTKEHWQALRSNFYEHQLLERSKAERLPLTFKLRDEIDGRGIVLRHDRFTIHVEGDSDGEVRVIYKHAINIVTYTESAG